MHTIIRPDWGFGGPAIRMGLAVWNLPLRPAGHPVLMLGPAVPGEALLGWILWLGLLDGLAKSVLRPVPRWGLRLWGLWLGWLYFREQGPVWAASLSMAILLTFRLGLADRYRQGRWQPRWMLAAGLMSGALLSLAPLAGVALTVALLLYTALHDMLHAREAQGAQALRQNLHGALLAWLSQWGLYWGLPALLLAVVSWSLWPPVWPGWEGAGYFTAYKTAMRQLAVQPWPQALWVAGYLTILGFLPVAGIWGVGRELPGRLSYRWLRESDDVLLLLWLGALGLLLGSFPAATVGSMAVWGAPACMIGFYAIQQGGKGLKEKLERSP